MHGVVPYDSTHAQSFDDNASSGGVVDDPWVIDSSFLLKPCGR
ncbi:hypothetical protein SAMN05216564_10123 [Halopenitus persicus]|uniref:Uncharacterized protein n=1 Tax=Halopenitus persicus TaxID=1048396 RepID=A0A1H3DKL7_9EURY|nr:hypothetical protein SAMN05216564_10123 [Halopenitus persicus]